MTLAFSLPMRYSKNALAMSCPELSLYSSAQVLRVMYDSSHLLLLRKRSMFYYHRQLPISLFWSTLYPDSLYPPERHQSLSSGKYNWMDDHTINSLSADLLEVAFFPSNTPACARIQDPVHALRIYFAPGAWSFMNCKTEGEMTPGRAPAPVDVKLEGKSGRESSKNTARDE